MSPKCEVDNSTALTLTSPSSKWWFLLFPLLFLASFSLSGSIIPNSSYIDASWQASIEYAANHQWQFGKDIVFTYGPFGFLTSKYSQGFFRFERIIFAITLSGLTAWFSISIAKALNGAVRYMFLAWLLLFANASDLEQNIFFVMACCSLKMIDKKRTIFSCLAFPVFLALLSLIKFTFLLVALMAVALCALHLAFKGDRRHAATLILSYLSAFCVFWKSMGQDFGSLLPWIHGSMEISSGYMEAMSLDPKLDILLLSLGAAAIFMCMVFYSGYRRLSNPPALTSLALILLFSLMTWKQGFVRSDEMHIFRFIFSFPLMSALLCADMNENGDIPSYRKWLFLPFVAIVFFCLAGIYTQFPLKNIVVYAGTNIPNQFVQLRNIATGNMQACFSDIPKITDDDLPAVKSLVGNGSIDVMSSNSWFAMANRLHYRPRPVVQSFSAYTPYLENLNLSFMKSKNRPDWMIVMMDSIDGRLPTTEDALLFPWLIRNYSLEWDDNLLLLFKAKAQLTDPLATALVSEQWVSFDQPIDFSKYDESGLILQAEIEPTFAGKLVGLLYHRPSLSITLEFDNEKVTKRLIPQIAKEGFLVSPLLLDINDVVRFYSGKKHKLKKISFGIPTNAYPLYDGRMKIRLLRVSL